jgi:hypothetical protein
VFAVTDDQLKTIMTAASGLPVEKRGVFIERVVARLGLHPRFTAAEFADAVQRAMQGLVHGSAA